MRWFNTEYKRILDAGERRHGTGVNPFSTGRLQLYPTEWQDITIDLRSLETAAAANPEAEFIWQDTLFNFNLRN